MLILLFERTFQKEVNKLYDSIDKQFYPKKNNNILQWLIPSYKTGLSITHTVDIGGHYYIIHPLEKEMKRDILTGNFIDNQNNLTYLSNKQIKNLFRTSSIRLEIIQFHLRQIYKILL